jgi:hypothetical protein
MKFVLFALPILPYTSEAASYFNLIDAKSKKVIGPLPVWPPAIIDYTYINATSSKLNIEAVFDPSIPVKSVRMTFDNPKKGVCRNVAPY